MPLPRSLAWLRGQAGTLVRLLAWAEAALYRVKAVGAIDDDPYAVIFPLLLAVVVWRHQVLHRQTLRALLGKRTFAAAEPPAMPARHARIAENIRREQRASLTFYDAHRPFVGAGKPRKPWLVVLELQPAAPAGPGGTPAADGQGRDTDHGARATRWAADRTRPADGP